MGTLVVFNGINPIFPHIALPEIMAINLTPLLKSAEWGRLAAGQNLFASPFTVVQKKWGRF